jgi:hypothetical protein
LWLPRLPIAVQWKEISPAALALKVKLEEIDTQRDAKGLENAFQTAKQKQVGAIMTISSRIFFAERKWIVELAGKYRLPAIYFQKEFVDEGGLMSYGADFDDLFRRAAVYVDKILKGAKPADLPVQQATKFEFVINLKAAKQIETNNSAGSARAGEQSYEMKFWIFEFFRFRIAGAAQHRVAVGGSYRAAAERRRLAVLGFGFPRKEPQRENDRNKSGDSSH